MSETVKPWFQITDETIGVWFVGFGTADWMCHVYREDHNLHITYRFKYYASPMPHDPRDVTEGNEFVIPFIGRDRIISDVDTLAYELYERFRGNQLDRILMMDRTVEEFFNELESKNWVHIATKH